MKHFDLRKSAKAAISFIVIIFLINLYGCTRRQPSEKPPIHLNPSMDNQEKYKPQAESKFFKNGSAMRMPVAGTVARGFLRADDIFYKGKKEAGEFVEKAPVEVSAQLLERGRERYEIYCSPCHGQNGDGRGPVALVKNSFKPPPPNLHSDSIRGMSDGDIFDNISNGIRNMPSYRHLINTKDRWAIVMYVRKMQNSPGETTADIPGETREINK